ncbi:hypothetical protein ACIBF5_14545 [Micromonospora sp. NPDC050417]|uniref:hypothetical protein n=1 Tax=Micromonospora sp. NPDC050417 TaxID=3364280 RepID=UPI0037988F3E
MWICYAALLDELLLVVDFAEPDPLPLLPEPPLDAPLLAPPLPEAVEPVDEVEVALPEPLPDEDSDFAGTELPPVELSDPFERESVR